MAENPKVDPRRAKTVKKVLALAYIVAILMALMTYNLLLLILTVAGVYLLNAIMDRVGLKIPMERPRWV